MIWGVLSVTASRTRPRLGFIETTLEKSSWAHHLLELPAGSSGFAGCVAGATYRSAEATGVIAAASIITLLKGILQQKGETHGVQVADSA